LLSILLQQVFGQLLQTLPDVWQMCSEANALLTIFAREWRHRSLGGE
jgi:hypothetical protein